MKRSAQLKRTGFKPRAGRPVHVRTPLGIEIVGSGERRRATYTKACALLAAPKRDYVRSRKLLDNVGLLPFCAFCGRHRPVVACHSNWEVHGKGGHIKADDNRVAAGCAECHRELDEGTSWPADEKKDRFWLAHVATVQLLLARGLWPDGVPIPDIATNPFAA